MGAPVKELLFLMPEVTTNLQLLIACKHGSQNKLVLGKKYCTPYSLWLMNKVEVLLLFWVYFFSSGNLVLIKQFNLTVLEIKICKERKYDTGTARFSPFS